MKVVGSVVGRVLRGGEEGLPLGFQAHDYVRVLAFGLAYFLAHQLAFIFPDSKDVIMLIWPAGGVGLTAFILCPRRLWLPLTVAFYVAGVTADYLIARRSLATGLGYMTANMVESIGSAALILRSSPDFRRFTRLREVLWLVVGALGVNALGACIGAGTSVYTRGTSFVDSWWSWYISDGLGVLVVGPFILVWITGWNRSFRLRRILEGVLCFLIWTGLCWFIFHHPQSGSYHIHPYVLVALLIWPAVRFGPRGVTLALIALFAVASGTIGRGPEVWHWVGADATTGSQLLALQIFMGVLAATGYLLAAGHAELKAADAALRASEERARTMLRTAMDAVWLLDASGKILDVNDAACRMLGYARDEIVGMSISGIESSESVSEIEFHLAKMKERGTDLFETTHRRKDGEKIQVEVSTTLLAKPHQILAFIRDITDRKRAEAERAALREELGQAQKMESVGRLAGGVAHDFNNMLGVIIGQAEMALEDLDKNHPLRASLDLIRHTAERSASLTRQLLTFARRQPISPRPIDLNEAVGGTLQMLRRLIGEHITLAWHPGEGLKQIKVDPSQVDQLLANLCVNARDSISGSGVVTIGTEGQILDETSTALHAACLPGEYIVLSVQDSGCGMSEEVVSHIFEPFYTTKGLGKGTGLGLATVYGIMQQNGGFITVTSEPGRGSTFRLFFPALIEDDTRASSHVLPEVQNGQGETILLVEDEPDLLELTAAVVERLGFNALTARSPTEALSLIQKNGSKVDLLLTDMVMPEMSGRELYQQCLSICPRLKCLFMSGYAANLMGPHGALEPGMAFIQKPYRKGDLAQKLHEVLRAG